MEAVVPGFLVDREAPALGRAGLLDGIVVAARAVGLDGVAVQQIGVGHAVGAVHFGPVVHAAQLGPAFLGHGDHPVGELQDQDGVVVAAGLVAMHLGAHLGVDRLDRRPAEHPAEELDGVAAHVHGHAAAGSLDVPEMRGVRAVVLLRLLQERGPAQRAGIQQLLEADVLGGEAQLLGIHQLHAGRAAGRDHPVGLGQVQAQRLLDHDVLAGRGGIEHDLAMQMIGNADHHQLDLRPRQQARGNRSARRECRSAGPTAAALPGVGEATAASSACGQCRNAFGMDRRNELRADESNRDRWFHGDGSLDGIVT